MRYAICLQGGDIDRVRVATDESRSTAAGLFVRGALMEEPLSEEEALAAVRWAEAHGGECQMIEIDEAMMAPVAGKKNRADW